MIINQWRDEAINLNSVANISVRKISDLDTTQTIRINEKDVGKYVLEVGYIMPHITGDISCNIVDEIGIYETEEMAKSVLAEIVITCKENTMYKMPDRNGCPFVDGE